MNAARWFEAWAPAAFGVGVAGVVAVLVCRGLGKPLAYPLAACAAGWVLGAAWAYRRVRVGFERDADALARLDLAHGLHNRLSSASAGVGAWPAARAGAVAPLRWRRSRATDFVTVAAVLLAAACLAPVGRANFGAPAMRPEVPPALRDLRALTQRLREEKAADPQSLEALEKRAEALLKQPESAWYDTTTMEASEHLRDRAEESLRDLDKDLAALRRATDKLAESGELRPEDLPADLAQSLGEALEGLELSELRPEKGLLDKLKGLKPGAMKPMTKAELESLRKALAEQSRKMRNASKKAGEPKAASKRAVSGGIPVFIFVPGGLSPKDHLKLALGPENELLVDKGLLDANAAESAAISASMKERPPSIRMQAGCKPGMMAPGLIPLPPPPGTDPNADDDLVDALEDILYGDSYAIYDAEAMRAALIKALRDSRLRLHDFELTSGNCSGGECSGKSCGKFAVKLGCTSSSGGPGGGGVSAPLTMGEKSAAQAGGKEALNANDRSHDTLGDLQQITAGKHKVDTNAYKGPVSGGAIAAEGDGSEAVWTDNLTPEERETLRKYFK